MPVGMTMFAFRPGIREWRSAGGGRLGWLITLHNGRIRQILS